MVWDWRVLRAEPIPSCWPNLLFIFCLLFSLFLPSMGWLCGVGVFRLIECSHSLPSLYCWLIYNNNNNYYYYNNNNNWRATIFFINGANYKYRITHLNFAWAYLYSLMHVKKICTTNHKNVLSYLGASLIQRMKFANLL